MVPSASAMESMSFASRSDLIASSSEATTKMALWSGETGVPPSLGWVAVMSAEVNSEQVIARSCENLRSRAVVLDDPAGAVDAEDKRPHRG